MDGSETVGGTECWIIESIPLNEEIMDEMGFDRKLIWIGKEDYMMRRTEYFNEDDELFKIMTAKDIKPIDPNGRIHMAMYMEVVNRENGRKSVMSIDKIMYNPEVKTEYFTLTYLERF
jgi:hypothetical protein